MAEPVVLHFVVHNLVAVRRFYDVIRVYRSTTGRAGPYAEVTGPGSGPDATDYQRIPLTDRVVYEFAHREGAPTDWYRTDYYNTARGTSSSANTPQRADLEQVSDVISVEEIKTNYLFGLDLTDDQGNELSDSVYEYYTLAAVDLLESELDISIRTRTISDTAIDGGLSAGPTERQDFLVQEYYKYIWLQLNRYPVISVEEVRLVLPSEQQVINFDPTWFHLNREKGQLMIIPASGSIAITALGQSGAWLPVVYGWQDFIPDVFRVRYTAGFATGVPAAIRNLVGKMAAIGPLHILGDLILGAGVAEESISMDGLSQGVRSTASATNSGYGARILHYEREIKREKLALYRTYRGVPMQVA